VPGPPGAGCSLANPRPRKIAAPSTTSRRGTDEPKGSASAAIARIIDITMNGVLKKIMHLIQRIFTCLPDVRSTLNNKKKWHA
jgi:hypothetical protein